MGIELLFFLSSRWALIFLKLGINVYVSGWVINAIWNIYLAVAYSMSVCKDCRINERQYLKGPGIWNKCARKYVWKQENDVAATTVPFNYKPEFIKKMFLKHASVCMWVCVPVCLCMHQCVCLCIHVNVSVCTHGCVCGTHVYLCVHICTCLYVHAHVCECFSTCTCVRVWVWERHRKVNVR